MYKIKIEEIEIEVTRKKVKNLQLTVKSPDGNVKITAPMFVNETQVRQFAESKIEWIRKHKKKYQNYVNREEIHYEAGEVHYFMGKPYILDVINHNKLPKIKINENRIELYIKPGSNKTEREKAIWDWYRDQFKEIIPSYIFKWEKVMGVSFNEFGIKLMKTRWGTCNIKAKRIWLNLELVHRPVHCLEFIVVHELAHLLERNHNARFKSIMDNYLPNWRISKAELDKIHLK